jgi:hypothetical protein
LQYQCNKNKTKTILSINTLNVKACIKNRKDS